MSAIEQVHANSLSSSQDLVSSEKIVREIEIHYSLDGFEPLKSERQKLDQLIGELNADPGLKVRIEGHTDNRGSDVYNAGLANERALYIKGYLVTKGVGDYRVTVAGYGEQDQKVACKENCTTTVHKQNRRTEIILYR